MKNKSVLTVILLVATMVLLSSCSSTQKFTVHGTPGTVIAQQYGQATVIDQSGQATLTMGRTISDYNHFLLAKAPNSDVWVPFALDYKDHNRGFTKTMAILSAAISGVGDIACVAMAISGVEGAAILIGGIPALGGLGLMLPLAIKSKYTYDCLDQSTNNNYIINPQSTTSGTHTCSFCGGTGEVIENNGLSMGNTKYCEKCKKTVPDYHYHTVCPKCKGTGHQ